MPGLVHGLWEGSPVIRGKKEALKILSGASLEVGSEHLGKWMESKGAGRGLREY